jgi:hypothetical protein
MWAPRKKTKTSSKLGLEHGFRSGLEDLNAKHLLSIGEKVRYEAHTLEYTQPGKLRKYTPDFILGNGIVIETKGRFLTADRQKHKLIKAAHPDLDLRFVFSNPHQRISKQSKTTYAAWCEHNGFLWADKTVPVSWTKEPALKRRLEACHKALKCKPMEK